MHGQGDVDAVGEAGGDLVAATLEHVARLHHFELGTGMGADSRLPRAGGEIGVGLRRRHALDDAVDDHLAGRSRQAEGKTREARGFSAISVPLRES